MLSDRHLAEAIGRGELVIDPLEEGQIQPASIDLRLGDTFAALPNDHPLFAGYIDPLAPPTQPHRFRTLAEGVQYPLAPHGFALACTVETVGLDDSLVGILAGKSSLARHGLAIECAGYVDPGFQGQLTLELANLTKYTIMLTPGMRIAQLAVYELSCRAMRAYGSKGLGSHYQHQTGPTLSRSHVRQGRAA